MFPLPEPVGVHLSERFCKIGDYTKIVQAEYRAEVTQANVEAQPIFYKDKQKYYSFVRTRCFFRSSTMASSTPLTKTPLLGVLYALAISIYSFNVTRVGMAGKL